MTNSALIIEAADMIAEFNPTVASMFRTQPFNRAALAEAFIAGFRTHSAVSLAVCAFVATVAARDIADRRVAAAREV